MKYMLILIESLICAIHCSKPLSFGLEQMCIVLDSLNKSMQFMLIVSLFSDGENKAEGNIKTWLTKVTHLYKTEH